MFDYLLSLIAPHDCLGCRTEGSLLCANCQLLIPLVPENCYRCGALTGHTRICQKCVSKTPLSKVVVAVAYKDTAKELVHRLKYKRAMAAVQPIASMIAAQIKNTEGVVVCHVPTATSRVRQRGYDQAEHIARLVAKMACLPHARLLARTGQQRQVGSSRQIREQQAKELFRVRHSLAGGRQRVLLIDDVITTGSTLEAAARTLKQAGAQHVEAAVFAAA